MKQKIRIKKLLSKPKIQKSCIAYSFYKAKYQVTFKQYFLSLSDNYGKYVNHPNDISIFGHYINKFNLKNMVYYFYLIYETNV